MIIPVCNVTLRENLLVSMGLYAGELDAAHAIDIPYGTTGEDELAEFVVECVDEYMKQEVDEPFDLFAENKLLWKYGRYNDEEV